MGFFDLFRPKWKHSNADVRAEAVKQMTADDVAVLSQIVRADKDARIRRLALKKIADPTLLGEIAESDPDEALRADAAEKASELLLSTAIGEGDQAASLEALGRIKNEKALVEVVRRAALAEVRKTALGRIRDEKALGEAAKKAADPQLRLAAVARVEEIGILREVAISDGVKEVAMAALDKIADAKTLEQIAGKAKQKSIKKAAKEKLDALREAAKPVNGMPEHKRRAEQALLCRTVEEAAASDDWAHAEKAVEASKAAWEALGTAPGDEPFGKRFERALTKFFLRREEHLRKQRALAELRAAKEREAAAKAEAEAARADEDDALIEIVRGADEEKAARGKREESEEEKAERERRQAEREKRQAEKAQREAEKAQRDAERAAERARREAEAEENARRLEEVAARLESLVETGDKKAIDAALKSAKSVVDAMHALKQEARGRYDAARAKLVARQAELNEAESWKRWANVPHLEKLVAQMKALSEREDLAGQELGKELKALQAAWKQVGPAPKEKSEALWKQFKELSDTVYGKVQTGRAVADEERAANLEKKVALCVRVEELAKIPDGEMKWKETSETVKAIQAEWKAIGPVTKDQKDAIWTRFRGACDAFFERRKAHWAEVDENREANQKKLEELCDKAESVLASSTTLRGAEPALPGRGAGGAEPSQGSASKWKVAADLLKSYQAEWKAVGPAPKEKSEELWKRFRAACDAFFERRKAAFAEQDEERAENLKKKEALVARVEALASAEDPEQAMSDCKGIQAEWKKIGPVPKADGDAIWAKFRAACDRVFERGRAGEPIEEVSPEAKAAMGISGFTNKLPLEGLLGDKRAEKPAAPAGEKKKREKKPPAAKAEPAPVLAAPAPEPALPPAKAEPVLPPAAEPAPVLAAPKPEPALPPTKAEPALPAPPKPEPVLFAPPTPEPAPAVAAPAPTPAPAPVADDGWDLPAVEHAAPAPVAAAPAPAPAPAKPADDKLAAGGGAVAVPDQSVLDAVTSEWDDVITQTAKNPLLDEKKP